MTVTGYELRYKGDTVGLCPTHREELGIAVEDCSSTVEDTMFRHGNGGSPCAVCGFDVLDCLSARALSDRYDTPREYCVVDGDERPPLSLGMCAELIANSQNIDGWAYIDLAPGEQPQEDAVGTTDDGTVFAKQVHHGDAEETLYVELSNRTAEYTYVEMHERATRVANLLDSFGLSTGILPHPFDAGECWHIIGFPEN